MIGNVTLYGNLGEKLNNQPTPNATRYAESLARANEALGISMTGEFTQMMSTGRGASNKWAESCMEPLRETQREVKKNFDTIAKSAGSSEHAKTLASLKYDQVSRDVKFMESYLKLTGQVMVAEALTNQLQVQEQVLMPLQYINYLQSTARHIVPAEVVDKEIFVRQKWVKEASVRGLGKTFKFPEALQSKEFLDAVLNADGKAIEHEVMLAAHPSSEILDIVSLFGTGYTAGKDKIEPVIEFKAVKLVGVADWIPLTSDYNTKVDRQKKGDFVIFKKIKDATNTVHDVKISGQVDFDACTMEFTSTANVEGFKIAATIKSGTFGRGITVKEYKEQFHYHVTKHIQGSFNWNYREVLEKMNFENTDLVVTAAELMAEVFDAAKDHYQFTELDKTYDELVTLEGIGMMSKDDFVKRLEIDLDVDPTKTALVTDNPGALRNTLINDGMTKLMLTVRDKYKPKTGWTTNMWTNLEIARILAPDHTVIGSGEDYGGVSSTVSVRGGSIAGYVYKMVETQREELTSTEIKMIPFINDPNVETFKFLQWETKRFDDNSYRDPAAPNQPSFHVVDHFQLIGVNKAMYKMNIKNKDKLMGNSEFKFA